MTKNRKVSLYDNSDRAYEYYNELAEYITVNNQRVTPEEVGDKLADAFPIRGLKSDYKSALKRAQLARKWLEDKYQEVGRPL